MTRAMGERGQVLPLMALTMAVLCGAAALAIDVGYLRYQQRIQQSATDSAALAGAQELGFPGAADVTAAARADAASNGFTHNGGTLNVAVNNGPSTGSYAGNLSAVEVIIRADHNTFFERYLGLPIPNVETRAVALAGGAGNHACLYVLKTTAPDTIFNGSKVTAPSCGIIANNASTYNGATITAASIGGVGAIITNGSTFSEAHPAHAIAAADPCPSIVGCAYLTSNPPALAPCTYPTQVLVNGGAGTINPGVYCGGLLLNGATVTVNPGMYVIKNGFTSNGSSMTGSNVQFYIATGQLTINGVGLNLSAPTTGNSAGFLFYQPLSNANGATLNDSMGGHLAGGLYFPSAQLTVNAGFDTWLMVISGWLTMNGTVTNIPSNSAFPGLRHAVLAE